MACLIPTIGRLARDSKGATAIEYALICAMIAVVVVGIAATGGALGPLPVALCSDNPAPSTVNEKGYG